MSTRAQRLTDELDSVAVDAMLVSNLVNLRYLTGFTGSNGLAIIGRGARLFVSDFRYIEQSRDEVDSEFERVTASQALMTGVPELLPDGPVRLGFESGTMTVDAHERARELLPERVELVPVRGLVERMRAIKDDGEIERIAAAERIADEAFEAVLAGGLGGRTEAEVAWALEREIRQRGAGSVSFPVIVAGGAQGALPHGKPRDVPLQRGQLIIIDWGAYLAGYASDCTRTVALGEPGPEAREAYELVLGAQQVGLDEVRGGADARAVDTAVREIIDGAGHAEHYGHGLGHGVGLEIHEAPTLSPRSEDTLRAGQVVTVEPGVYLPGRFGVRIEDLVVVTDTGCRILTSATKALRIVE